jgi:hypothetical protein
MPDGFPVDSLLRGVHLDMGVELPCEPALIQRVVDAMCLYPVVVKAEYVIFRHGSIRVFDKIFVDERFERRWRLVFLDFLIGLVGLTGWFVSGR